MAAAPPPLPAAESPGPAGVPAAAAAAASSLPWCVSSRCRGSVSEALLRLRSPPLLLLFSLPPSLLSLPPLLVRLLGDTLARTFDGSMQPQPGAFLAGRFSGAVSAAGSCARATQEEQCVAAGGHASVNQATGCAALVSGPLRPSSLLSPLTQQHPYTPA
jgi:hypothetical protein